MKSQLEVNIYCLLTCCDIRLPVTITAVLCGGAENAGLENVGPYNVWNTEWCIILRKTLKRKYARKKCRHKPVRRRVHRAIEVVGQEIKG